MRPEPKRRALGKGLGSLIPEAPTLGEEARDERVVAGTPIDVPVDRIRPNPQQPRTQFREEEIDALGASIKESGVLQPLVARAEADGRYTLIAGERRWRAAKKIGLTHVPIVIKPVADERLLEYALIENIQRDDLGPLETARAFRELVRRFGMTQAEVAQRVGKPRSTVTNFLRLLDLPDDVQKLLDNGNLDFGHGRALAGLPDRSSQSALAKLAAERHLSVREVEQRVKSWLRRSEPAAPESRRDPNVTAAERTLSRALEAVVAITVSSGGRGKIEIRFAGEEDLDRLYRQLLRSTSKPPA